MADKKRLFVYDFDGTIVAPLFALYASARSKNPDLTFAEFKAQSGHVQKALIAGMKELIRYTATLGQNVLVSGGDPVGDAENNPELKELLGYFKSWVYEGKEVSFGKEPEGLLKENPKVAKGLLKAFDPSEVVVIGDSVSECELAKNIGASVLLFRTSLESVPIGYEEVPHRYVAQTGYDMKKILENHFGDRRYHETQLVSKRLKRFRHGNE